MIDITSDNLMRSCSVYCYVRTHSISQFVIFVKFRRSSRPSMMGILSPIADVELEEDFEGFVPLEEIGMLCCH